MNAMEHQDAGFFGYSHLTGGFAGGIAEYVRGPFGETNLLLIPDSVLDELAIYLSDVLPTSYHAVVDTGVKGGDVVGIWVSLAQNHYSCLMIYASPGAELSGFCTRPYSQKTEILSGKTGLWPKLSSKLSDFCTRPLSVMSGVLVVSLPRSTYVA